MIVLEVSTHQEDSDNFVKEFETFGVTGMDSLLKDTLYSSIGSILSIFIKEGLCMAFYIQLLTKELSVSFKNFVYLIVPFKLCKTLKKCVASDAS